MSVGHQEILAVLSEMKKYKFERSRSNFEIVMGKISFYLKISGISFFFILLSLFFLKGFFDYNIFKIIVLSSSLLSLMCVALWISVDLISDATVIYRFKTVEAEAFNQAIVHDDENVRRIADFDSETLKVLMKQIDMRMDRLKARMIIMVGGPDKIAIFSLGSMGLLNLKDVDKYNQFLGNDFFIWVLALLFGIGAGGMMLNHILGLYAYQRDIISLALMRKSAETSHVV